LTGNHAAVVVIGGLQFVMTTKGALGSTPVDANTGNLMEDFDDMVGISHHELVFLLSSYSWV
jgi:hypothetical protein